MSSKRKTRTAHSLLLAATFLSAAASLVIGFFYFTLYWPFRGRFNEEGRYFDEADLVLYHAQTGLLIAPMLAFMALAILSAAIWRIRRQPAPGNTV